MHHDLDADMFEAECYRRDIEVDAFVIGQDGNEISLNFDSPWFGEPDEDYEFIAVAASSRPIQQSSKFRVRGVIRGRSFWGTTSVRRATFDSVELTPQEEAAKQRLLTRGDTERLAREAAAFELEQLIEQDKVLLEFAQKTRKEMMEKAIRHQSTQMSRATIDSFELPGNRFVVCELSWPGPVYSCDGQRHPGVDRPKGGSRSVRHGATHIDQSMHPRPVHPSCAGCAPEGPRRHRQFPSSCGHGLAQCSYH